MAEAPTKPSDQRPDHPVAAGQPLLAFVHIPRTGGGTLSSAISKNYSRLRGIGNYQKSPEQTRYALERIGKDPGPWKAAGDHAPYGLFLRHLPADTRYITQLRDPVDRVLSHYYFHAQAGRLPERGAEKLRSQWAELLNHERIERDGPDSSEIVVEPDADVSLEAGLRRRIVIYDNFMTRFLWGGETLFGELPPDALERAKANLSRFWFVGFRERLDDSIILLGRKLGVGLMPYHRRHVSQKRPPLEETPDELRELIVEHNALDVELYRFSRERFEATAPSPAELAEEAEELRRLSIAVTAEGEAHQAGKKERLAAKRAAHEAREAERAAVRAERGAADGEKKKKRRARDVEATDKGRDDAPGSTSKGSRKPRKVRSSAEPTA